MAESIRSALRAPQHDVRTTRLRLQVYAALAAWPPDDIPSTLTNQAIAHQAKVSTNQMSKMFGSRATPVLGRSFDSPAARAVAEAKEFTFEGYLAGWRSEVKDLGLTRRQRVYALVQVVASWAGSHPGLAQLSDCDLPVGLEDLLRSNTALRAPVREVLVDAVVNASVERLTPISCTSAAGAKLSVLDLDEDRDLDQKAAELAGSVSDFIIELLDNPGSQHPDLVFALRRAVGVLQRARQEEPA